MGLGDADYIYHIAGDPSLEHLFSAGKYLPLTKWKKSAKDGKWKVERETQESRLCSAEFKSVSLVRDRFGHLWLHDVLSKKIMCFSADLELLGAVKGHSISLCTLR